MFNQEALAERPVYALDLPGHGGSAKEVGDGKAMFRPSPRAVIDFLDAGDRPGRISSAIRSAAPSRCALALDQAAAGRLGDR